MVYINSWQQYQEAAENLYANSPRKVCPAHNFQTHPLSPCPIVGEARARSLHPTFEWISVLTALGDPVQRKMEIVRG